MNKTPKISVITPSFNQAEYIEATIISVLEQDYSNIEHIVIDGGSTDGTIEILNKYDGRIRWVSEADNGQAEALNKGFRMARGEILGWLNADDLYNTYTVKTAVAELIKHPDISLVHGAGQYIDQSGNVIMTRKGGDFGLEKLIGIDTIMSISVFFRRSVIDKVGYLDETLHYVLDWEYWVRMAMSGLKLRYIPGPVLAMAREHTDSKTIKSKELFWQERFKVFEKIFGSSETPKEIKELEKRAYSGVFASSAYFYLRYGKLGKSFSALLQAVRLWPGILFMYSPVFLAENVIQIVKGNLYLWKQKKAEKAKRVPHVP